MCGIAGYIVSAKSPQADLNHALSLIAHRGPDGQGIWSEETSQGGSVALGHRRLSIIDLSDSASQPMQDITGRFVITYNGEVYNYLEVRAELAALGARFATASDTEVILEAYKAWGAECLSRLNGMFSFALYDRPAGRLFCARDRFGEKPFLYAAKPGFFAFASEYKALLSLPGVGAEIDEIRLIQAAHNQSTGLDSDRQTVFRAINQLLPGEALELDVGAMSARTWRYYSPVAPTVREDARAEDVFAEFRELLIDAVRIRMRSDVEVGSCLSGGLDSSAIVCIARHLLGDGAPYHTFTGRFPGTEADEWSYAQTVVADADVVNHCVEPTVDGFIDELPQFVWHNELPVGSSSQYAQWCVFRLAKQQGVTVLLDGQGSDELLGGYEQYFADYVATLAERGERGRLAEELPRIRERYPLALAPPARGMRDRLPLAIRHSLANRMGKGSSLLYGLRLDVARAVSRESARPEMPGFHRLGGVLAQDSFGRYLTTLLRYGDRNSMAHSREVRLPFCEHRLAEFAFALPPHLLMGDVQTKRLLRESMRGLLPEAIRTRWNKQGFRPPQDLWFKSPRLLSTVRDAFASSSFRESSWWMPGVWDRMLTRIEAGDLGLGWTVWHPFMIEMWRRHLLQEVARPHTLSAPRAVA